MKTQMNGPRGWPTRGEPRSVPSARPKPPRLTLRHIAPHSHTSQSRGGAGSPRRGLTGAEISAVGKCSARRQKAPRRGAPRAALPFASATEPRSPGTPPLPARLDRLATAQGGHRSFSRSLRPCTRPSALRGPPTPGKARPHTPIGRSHRTSLAQLVEPSPLPP